MQNTEKQTLTVEEAARRLGIGRNNAYAAARNGDIPTIRIGKRILIPKVALEQLLEGAA
jgi:excisionase family DNA binding protein